VLADRAPARAEKWLSRLSRKDKADLALLLEQLLLSAGLLQIFTLLYDPVNGDRGIGQVAVSQKLHQTQSGVSRKVDRGCKLIRSYLKEHYGLGPGYE